MLQPTELPTLGKLKFFLFTKRQVCKNILKFSATIALMFISRIPVRLEAIVCPTTHLKCVSPPPAPEASEVVSLLGGRLWPEFAHRLSRKTVLHSHWTFENASKIAWTLASGILPSMTLISKSFVLIPSTELKKIKITRLCFCEITELISYLKYVRSWYKTNGNFLVCLSSAVTANHSRLLPYFCPWEFTAQRGR